MEEGGGRREEGGKEGMKEGSSCPRILLGYN
jgi:hypothetical protein